MAARRPARPTQHIRREDECEITFCDLLTAMDDRTDDPIAVVGAGSKDLATYADHDYLPGFAICHTCANAYEAL